MQQLYQAVAVPSFSYAADIWFSPIERPTGCKMAWGSVGVAWRLTSVQQIATTAITGALCTFTTDIFEVHADIWPIEILFHRMSQGGAVAGSTTGNPSTVQDCQDDGTKGCKTTSVATPSSPSHLQDQACQIQDNNPQQPPPQSE